MESIWDSPYIILQRVKLKNRVRILSKDEKIWVKAKRIRQLKIEGGRM